MLIYLKILVVIIFIIISNESSGSSSYIFENCSSSFSGEPIKLVCGDTRDRVIQKWNNPDKIENEGNILIYKNCLLYFKYGRLNYISKLCNLSNISFDSFKDLYEKTISGEFNSVDLVMIHYNELQYIYIDKLNFNLISGIVKKKYNNGKIHWTIQVENGFANGTLKSYYENGELEQIGQFKDGIAQGDFKVFFENSSGKIQREGFYNNGKLNGENKIYDDTGIIIEKRYYINGIIDRVFLYFNESEIIKLISYYQNDEVYKFEEFHFNGKIKRIWNKSKLLDEIYYENENLKIKYSFNQKGQVNKYYHEYYEDGNIFMKADYKDGNPHGQVKYYNKNGKINLTENYVNGVLDGKKIFYTPEGKLCLYIYYKKGVPVSGKNQIRSLSKIELTEIEDLKKISCFYKN
jgi:antitoxin component YwqK of YwqJK toxin-antitoxin module